MSETCIDENGKSWDETIDSKKEFFLTNGEYTDKIEIYILCATTEFEIKFGFRAMYWTYKNEKIMSHNFRTCYFDNRWVRDGEFKSFVNDLLDQGFVEFNKKEKSNTIATIIKEKAKKKRIFFTDKSLREETSSSKTSRRIKSIFN